MTGPGVPAVPHASALAAWRRAAPAPPRDLDLAVDVLLASHHPDHGQVGRTRLEVGSAAGRPCPEALARLLQANAVIDDVDVAGVPMEDTDVLVVGGGGAGCIAALTAVEEGRRVVVVTKLDLGDSNTVMAEGGMQAAIGPEDSLQDHHDDTVRGGHGTADRQLVATMVAEGPESVRWLIDQGMRFDLAEGHAMGGTLRRGPAGGTSAPRLHSFRDLTGLEMMRVLREAVRLHPRIVVLERHAVVELLSDGHRAAAGAVLHDLDRRRSLLIRAGAVVLATGGSGRIGLGDLPTSNHYGATADGLVLAYRIGAEVVDVDSFQLHPTGLAWPWHLRGLLVTEAVRGAGARLVNGRGERFVDELRPRDEVAAAVRREVAGGRGVERDGAVGVFLDVPTLVAEVPDILDERLSALRRLAARAGIDPAAEPLLVTPTLHFHNGGVVIDPEGATSVPGLFAAGEVAGGVHGRNRLMGNALLEVVVFGRRAGRAAARHARHERSGPVGLAHVRIWQRALVGAGLPLDVRAPLVFPTEGNVDLRARLRRDSVHEAAR